MYASGDAPRVLIIMTKTCVKTYEMLKAQAHMYRTYAELYNIFF